MATEAQTALELVPRDTQPTPMSLMQLAMTQGAGIDTISKLMDLQLRWEASEAKKAFVSAMAQFKASPPVLEKNKLVSFGKTAYRHATLDHVAAIVGEALSRHGLSFRWNTAQTNGRIQVTCILQHAAGHSESVTLEAPPDESGSKNSIQQVGSTVTYLERYTLLAATGMATQEQDNDGITNGELKEKLDKIESSRTVEELQQAFKSAFHDASEQKDYKALELLTNAKDKRKADIK